MSFIENLDWRYATQKFNGKILSEDKIEFIKKSIKFSPSSLNIQPYKILIIENSAVNKDLINRLEESAYNQKQISTCSHLFVFCGLKDVNKRIDELIELNYKKAYELTGEFEDYKKTMYQKASSMNEIQTKDWVNNQVHVVLGFALATCTELKIDSCPVGGFDREAFSKILNLDSDLRPVVLLAVGERDESDVPLPKVRFEGKDLFI